MASGIITQAGDKIYTVDPNTGAATELTLPSGVTIDATLKPAFAVMNNRIFMGHSPSHNLLIDPIAQVVTKVTLEQPDAPTLGSSGSGLTGTFIYRVSVGIKDGAGNVVTLSVPSDSVSITVTDDQIDLSDIPLGTDDGVNFRRIWRSTADGGSTMFKLVDIDDNTTTTYTDTTADAALPTIPDDLDLIVPPPGSSGTLKIRQVVAWKKRLWATVVDYTEDDTNRDQVYCTELESLYAWPNQITIGNPASTKDGVIGLIPRQDQLGAIKRTGLWQNTGDAPRNFRVVEIVNGKGGCLSPESIINVGNEAYWLGFDGVYEWNSKGVVSTTDDTVAPWFKSTRYFERSRFPNAFAKYNELRNHYELHLASVGSSTEDRWVALNLTNRKWYGPHKSDLLTPASAVTVNDANGNPVTLVGSTAGHVYMANDSEYRDGESTAIDFDVYGRWHHGNAPAVTHYWGELSVMTQQETGGTLTITPYLQTLAAGILTSAAGTAISHTLTKGREVLRRLGFAVMVRLRFRENTADQGVSILGYELPYHEVGRR